LKTFPAHRLGRCRDGDGRLRLCPADFAGAAVRADVVAPLAEASVTGVPPTITFALSRSPATSVGKRNHVHAVSLQCGCSFLGCTESAAWLRRQPDSVSRSMPTAGLCVRQLNETRSRTQRHGRNSMRRQAETEDAACRGIFKTKSFVTAA
jgi:hypothetical protein